MPLNRHFFTPTQPLLPQAARWLLSQMKTQPGGWVAAVPSARAGRRLREWLAREAGGALADPPPVVVAGHLLEALAPAWGQAAPDILLRQAQLALALRELPLADQRLLSKQLAESQGGPAAWTVAGRLLQTLQALWGGGLRAAALVEESPRHAALAQLEALYATRHPQDPDLRRLAQLAAGGPAPLGMQVALIGCVDLPGVVAQTLRRWGGGGLAVHALVPAAEAEADAFDDLGQVLTGAWSPRALPLAAGALVGVPSPAQEHEAVLRLLERAGPVAPEELTVVLGNEAAAPHLAAQLAGFGLRCRVAAGEPLASRAPAALALAILALWREESHAELRQVAAAYPKDQVPEAEEIALLEEARAGVLDDLRHLPETARQTTNLLRRLALLPGLNQRQPMAGWVAQLGALVAGAFPGSHAETSPSGQALQAMGERLQVLATLPLPPLSALEAAGILQGALAATRLPFLGEAAGGAELVGILEALLDEAPILAVTGAVEGALPQNPGADGLLPNNLRQRLGLPDETSLRARDKAILALAMPARRLAQVVVPRHGLEGDPLQPAQLLLEGLDTATLTARCLFLFGEERDQAQSGLPLHAPLAPDADAPRALVDGFLPLLPRPVEADRWQAQLETKGVSVTTLRRMLACPARFALEYAERIRATELPPAELDGGGFGTLLHEVLHQFHAQSLAQPAWRPDEAALTQALEAWLNREADKTFGAAPGLAVALQLERARQRLGAFARQQQQWWAEGWQVAAAEQEWSAKVELPEGRVRLHGRVDRVDRHPLLGLRIMDFKTSEDGKNPRQTHLKKDGWADLQLPLYLYLAWENGVPRPHEAVTTGYVLLDPGGGGWSPADFDDDERDAAVATAMDLLSRILRQEFPVGEAPAYPDGLETLLCDAAPDRAARLARAEREGGAR